MGLIGGIEGDHHIQKRNVEHGVAMFHIFVSISMAPNLEPNLKANGKPMLPDKM